MTSRCLWAAMVGLAVGAAAGAEEPKPGADGPPFQRVLTGADAKTAADLERRLAELTAAKQRDEALKVAEQLLTLRAAAQGKDHWQVRDAREKVADLRRPPTAEQNEQCAEAQRLHERADALCREGKARDALPFADKALALVRRAHGPDHRHTVFGLRYLAGSYQRTGKPSEAEPLFKEALRVCRKLFGDEHPETVTSRIDLGALYADLERLSAAEPLFKQALWTARRLFGGAHPFTAYCQRHLGKLYQAGCQVADAEMLLADALRVTLAFFGDEHPETAAVRSELGELYVDMYKLSEAEPLLAGALRVNRKVFGDDHPAVGANLRIMGRLYSLLGRSADAEVVLKEALRVSRKHFGADHPETAISTAALGELYLDLCKLAEAEPLLKDALRMNQTFFGNDHLKTAISRRNLGLLYMELSKFPDAERLLTAALRATLATYGDDHSQTTVGRAALGTLYLKWRKFAEAEILFADALRADGRAFGDDHPETAASLRDLGALYLVWGKFATAEPLLRRATAAYEAVRVAAAGRGIDRALIGVRCSSYLLQAANALARGDAAAAFTALESDLGRGLLDELAARRPAALDPKEAARRDEISARLGRIGTDLLDLTVLPAPTAAERAQRAALAAERAALRAELSELAAAANRRQVADLAALQKALPPDAAWVTWLDLSDDVGRVEEHWACVVRRTGPPRWERLPGAGDERAWTADDTDLPNKLRFAIAGDRHTPPAGPAGVNRFAEQLQAQRVAPLAKHLDGVKTLFVVATGPMAGVPVEVLAPGYAVCYVPSGTFLARTGSRPGPKTVGALALGDPTFQPAPGALARGKRLPPGGLLIRALDPNGAAARAGLGSGDVLLRYGGAELADADALRRAIAARAEQKSVAVTVWRERADEPLTCTVSPGPLGVVVATDPAPVALANRRALDDALARRGGGWGELPGTRVEVERLRALFGARATVLTGPDASEWKLDALRRAGELKKYRYLHFATHGAGNTVHALESCLVLARCERPPAPAAPAPGPQPDGFLTAREVLDAWELDAELVVLSACETAIGCDGGGDGALGFAQAFLTAGSRSVCLSLWKVEDLATALLMDRFYQNLLGKRPGLVGPMRPMGKAAALAEAKAWLRGLSSEEVLKHAAAATGGAIRGPGEKPLKLIPPAAVDGGKGDKPYAHPRYWAAFVLIGDPN